tara:strand:- start:2396 stop:2719 length:324 start_codon:yes stop_codon:yes gene_type:complete
MGAKKKKKPASLKSTIQSRKDELKKTKKQLKNSEQTLEAMMAHTKKKPATTRVEQIKTPEKTTLALPAGTLLRIKEAADSVGITQSGFMRQAIFIALQESERRRGLG